MVYNIYNKQVRIYYYLLQTCSGQSISGIQTTLVAGCLPPARVQFCVFHDSSRVGPPGNLNSLFIYFIFCFCNQAQASKRCSRAPPLYVSLLSIYNITGSKCSKQLKIGPNTSKWVNMGPNLSKWVQLGKKCKYCP